MPDRSTLIILPTCEAEPGDDLPNGCGGPIPPRGISEGGGRADGRLTALEIAVLNGLAAGLSVREIALQLMLFEPAIRAAVRSMCRTLGVRSRADAVACFAGSSNGAIDPCL